MDVQEGRKIGPATIVGLDGEPIDVQHWDKGNEYGVTYYSLLHSDHVIMTHSHTESRIRFADTGMGVYGLNYCALSAEGARADVEHVFYNLIKRLNRTYRHMTAEEGLPALLMIVQCEERG